MVVVVHVVGNDDSNFACLVADPPRSLGLFSVCLVVVVVVVVLCGRSWGCLGEVCISGQGCFGLRFGVEKDCGRELPKGVAGVV